MVTCSRNPAWAQATAATGQFSTVVEHWAERDKVEIAVGVSSVAAGDLLVAVAGVTAAGVDHGALLRLIATAERPLKLTFCSPDFLGQIVNDRPQHGVSRPKHKSPRSSPAFRSDAESGWEATTPHTDNVAPRASRSALEGLAGRPGDEIDRWRPGAKSRAVVSPRRQSVSPSPRRRATVAAQARYASQRRGVWEGGHVLPQASYRYVYTATAGVSAVPSAGPVHERLADWRSFTV